jgi:hypothetical protein
LDAARSTGGGGGGGAGLPVNPQSRIINLQSLINDAITRSSIQRLLNKISL